MIQMSQGRFSLHYDPVVDTARLLFDGALLVADSDRPNCWTVHDGPSWFEFQHSRARRIRGSFGSDLRGKLAHIRAMIGYATDTISEIHRHGELLDLRRWDKHWKTYFARESK